MSSARIIFLSLVVAALIGGILQNNGSNPEERFVSSRRGFTFADYADYFKNLAQEKGAVYAYEVLRRSSFPPNIDLHLLAHVVGDELYKQKSIQGISDCTNDFRNACSHSVVVGALFELGESTLKDIRDACRKAPGGTGAYTMCFHGLGHGVLASVDYDMREAIRVCEKTGTKEYENREAIECIGGAVMEMISGGFHDRNLWKKGRAAYLEGKDPLRLCSATFMPKEARPICYDYLTPYLWEFVGANMGYPTAEDFDKSFPLCERIGEPDERHACFSGFGKEFLGLTVSRDVRLDALASLRGKQFSFIYDWCSLAGNARGISACLESASNSLYWGGENDRSISIRFCRTVSDLSPSFGDECFGNLIENVKNYIADIRYRQTFCKEIPARHDKFCKEALL